MTATSRRVLERWLASAEEAGLPIGADSRGLVHVTTDGAFRNCQQTGDGHGLADRPVTRDSRVCMWCRELPGRRRHERAILGGDDDG